MESQQLAGGWLGLTPADIATALDAVYRGPGPGRSRNLTMRVYLAARAALHARKFVTNPGPIPVAELAAACESSRRETAAALRWWIRTGVLIGAVSRNGTFVARVAEQLPHAPTAAVDYYRDTRGRLRATVPVPRRILRELCRRGTRATITATLAACGRCIYPGRGGDVRTDGRVNYTRIAAAFGVCVDAVRRAFLTLAGWGWINRDDAPDNAFVARRHGRRFSICASFRGTVARLRARFSGHINHTRPYGASNKPNPGLVSARELSEPAAIERHYVRAVRVGKIDASDAARERYYAAFAYAARKGTRNAPGLAVTVATRPQYPIPERDYDTAYAQIKAAAGLSLPNGPRGGKKQVQNGPACGVIDRFLAFYRRNRRPFPAFGDVKNKLQKLTGREITAADYAELIR